MKKSEIIYDAHVNFYMRIYDSYMYGGEGSVGYAMEVLKHFRNFDSSVIDKVAESINNMSNVLKVPSDKIEFISYQEYVNSACGENEDYEETITDE